MPKVSAPQAGIPQTGSIAVTLELGGAVNLPEFTQRLWGGVRWLLNRLHPHSLS